MREQLRRDVHVRVDEPLLLLELWQLRVHKEARARVVELRELASEASSLEPELICSMAARYSLSLASTSLATVWKAAPCAPTRTHPSRPGRTTLAAWGLRLLRRPPRLASCEW